MMSSLVSNTQLFSDNVTNSDKRMSHPFGITTRDLQNHSHSLDAVRCLLKLTLYLTLTSSGICLPNCVIWIRMRCYGSICYRQGNHLFLTFSLHCMWIELYPPRYRLWYTKTTHISPKFHLARHVTSCHVSARHDTTRTTCRACGACRDERVEPCLFHNGGRRRSSTDLVFCALDLHESQDQLMEKNEMDRSTLVHAAETPQNTCRASSVCRACRDERVAPCCPTSTTCLDTSRYVSSQLFPMRKCMG